MPLLIDGFVRRLVQQIAVEGLPDIWEKVCDTVIDCQGVLNNTPLVVAYRDATGNVVGREIGLHSQSRPYGVLFSECGGQACPRQGHRAHIVAQSRVDNGWMRARIRCIACQWHSGWVRELAIKEYLMRVDHRTPTIFYHAFPTPALIANMFLSVPSVPQKGQKPRKARKAAPAQGTDVQMGDP